MVGGGGVNLPSLGSQGSQTSGRKVERWQQGGVGQAERKELGAELPLGKAGRGPPKSPVCPPPPRPGGQSGDARAGCGLPEGSWLSGTICWGFPGIKPGWPRTHSPNSPSPKVLVTPAPLPASLPHALWGCALRRWEGTQGALGCKEVTPSPLGQR